LVRLFVDIFFVIEPKRAIFIPFPDIATKVMEAESIRREGPNRGNAAKAVITIHWLPRRMLYGVIRLGS
jgi:hypothetical protein